jgi:menaquinone-dependent protoporphyrinogen IX oxidase
MKGLVIYKGKYGATKQYAMWIGQELRLPVGSADRFPVRELPKYDYILIGSSVYIGKLEIRKWVKKNLPVLLTKKTFLFQVAASPADQKEIRAGYNKASIPQELLKKSETFYLPGRMKMKYLSGWDRFMLRMGARMTKDPVEKKKMLTDFNNVKRENIEPLIEAVRNFTEISEPEIAYT